MKLLDTLLGRTRPVQADLDRPGTMFVGSRWRCLRRANSRGRASPSGGQRKELRVGQTASARGHRSARRRSAHGAIMGVHVADVGVKEALLADDPKVLFTTPHFDGYPAVLVRLDQIAVSDLEELIVEAWLARAPKRLAKEYLDASR
jgi:hypothetical protein